MMIFRRWRRLPDGFLLARFVAMQEIKLRSSAVFALMGSMAFFIISFGIKCAEFYDPILQPYWLYFRYNCSVYLYSVLYRIKFYLIEVLKPCWLDCHYYLVDIFCFVLSVQTSFLIMSSHVIFASASFIFASAGEFII